MGKLDGKVAMITGGARGQGRSHAIKLAKEGADIVICDICTDIATVEYPLGSEAQLSETVRLVEEQGRRCIAVKADVRDLKQIQAVADQAITVFGKIDILCANAGIGSHGIVAEMSEEVWKDTIDVNLTGVFNAMRAVLPHMIKQKYGRIVATSSMAARAGYQNIAHYVASKWGILGLVKSAAKEVAAMGITVNAVCPGSINTDLIQNEATYRIFCPELENPTKEDALPIFQSLNAIPIPWMEPEEVSNAILFLVSEDARYITGEAIHVAAGQNANNAC